MTEQERECQAVWRCAIGDAVGALDILKGRWEKSRRKADREAAAKLNGVANLIWAARDPAPANYREASDKGKALHTLVRSAIDAPAPTPASQEA